MLLISIAKVPQGFDDLGTRSIRGFPYVKLLHIFADVKDTFLGSAKVLPIAGFNLAKHW